MTTKKITPNNNIHSMIRVNHAGELGAKWIYQGQLDAIQDLHAKEAIQHMKDQEQRHLDYFESQMKENQVRPTALLPLWRIIGYSAGYISAKVGPKTAMLCTEAVENVIEHHYQDQLNTLDKDPEAPADLRDHIHQFRQEEIEHKDHAINEGSQSIPAHALIKKCIQIGVKTAIQLSKRI